VIKKFKYHDGFNLVIFTNERVYYHIKFNLITYILCEEVLNLLCHFNYLNEELVLYVIDVVVLKTNYFYMWDYEKFRDVTTASSKPSFKLCPLLSFPGSIRR